MEKSVISNRSLINVSRFVKMGMILKFSPLELGKVVMKIWSHGLQWLEEEALVLFKMLIQKILRIK